MTSECGLPTAPATTWRRLRRVSVLGGLEIGHLKFNQRAMRRTLHETYVLAVARAAPHVLWVAGQAHRVNPGSIILLAPHEVFGAEQIGYAPWGYRVIYPRRDQLLEAIGTNPDECSNVATPIVFPARVVEDPSISEALVSVHRQLETVSVRGLTETDACATQLERRVRETVRRIVSKFGSSAEASTETRCAIARARAFIHAHSASSIRVSEIASYVGLSPYHFIRVFHEAVGMPPYTYVDHVRVSRARALLGAGVPISRVAFLSGFADQSHLTRHFKRAVGVTPGAYCRASDRQDHAA